MAKSATDVMQEILFSAIVDSLDALKTASKGLPNTMVRDINSIHANTTFADLPNELQAAITAGVRSAFTRLQKEGYTVSDGKLAQQRPAGPPRRGPGDAKRGPGDHKRSPRGSNNPANRRGPRPPR